MGPVRALTSEQRDDFLARGFSRRHLGRLAAIVAAGAAMPASTEAALAHQGLSARRDLPPDAVLLNANENPLGPCPEAIEAIRAVVARGGRYLYGETFAFIDAMAAETGLAPESVMAFAGSSDALHRAVLGFCSPARGLVVADPGYEAAERAAKVIGAPVAKVPLRADWAHDCRAMATVDPAAGLIYVCNPNNPTGTVTPTADLDELIARKPEGCVVLLDEAYLHLSNSAEPAVAHVKAGRDVIILRTFSKIYGMAGLRAGAALGRPDLLEKLRGLGANLMPATGMAGATASLKARGLVDRRRRLIGSARDELCDWLARRGAGFIPSESNKVMIDVGRPGAEVGEALFALKVVVGRTWKALPNHLRVSIGTPDEMAKFRSAFEQVMA